MPPERPQLRSTRIEPTSQRPRLIVLTDISSLASGVREPDDGQSLIRLMLYTNDLDVEGLIASSNLGHGQVVRPELIHTVVDAYAQVRPSLLLHSDRYPSAEALHARVRAGQPIAGPKVPVAASIGEGKDTDASRWITEIVDRPDPRPVWVTIWGGAADLAQALWYIQHTRTAVELQAFVARLRVHAIYDQDSTCAWIKQQFPDLFYITRGHGVRGMYRGGDLTLVSPEWVEGHVRDDHGALGALYPNYDGGDIWSRELGRVRGVKEGDTPSFLALLPNGLGDPLQPTWGNWGGRFEGSANRFADARDAHPSAAHDPDPRMAAVHRWRPAFQADFAARLDWCVQPYAGANHPPVHTHDARLRELTVAPGARVTLDARGWMDPDGDRLTYQWSFYREPSTYAVPLMIEDPAAEVTHCVAPQVTERQTIHIVVTVQDRGSPPLSSYERLILTVDPDHR